MTPEHGRIKTVAKAARRAQSRFAGLDLFFRCEIGFSRSRRSELHQLQEARLLEPHAQLRFDYTRLALASYFVELLELVTEPGHPEPELYGLLERALVYLEANPATIRALQHFESEVAKQVGIHDPGAAPAAAIAHAFHRLPPSRQALAGLPAR